MRNWIFEKAQISDSPSKKDNVDRDTEARYRREGARFIWDVGTELKLSPNPTLATAAVYFQRFYMYHSFRYFPRHVTGLGCLFLAGKVEETPKKCRDLLQVARDKLNDHHWSLFGRDPRDLQEEVMSVERVLLQTLKFDLQVRHPYEFLCKYAKKFNISHDKNQKMVQMAWIFINDSFTTTLCLQWEPEIIAIALCYLASKLAKVEVTDWVGKTGTGGNWWDTIVEDMSLELMEEQLEAVSDICHQVLDLYSNKNPQPGTQVAAAASTTQAATSSRSRAPTTTAQSWPASTSTATTPTIARPAAVPGPPGVLSVVPAPQQHPSIMTQGYPAPPLPPNHYQPPPPPTPPASNGARQRPPYAVPVAGTNNFSFPPPNYAVPPPTNQYPGYPPPPPQFPGHRTGGSR